MQKQTICMVSEAIRYIEEHLQEKLELGRIAEELHYSKFHLHREFTDTIGFPLHGYVKRRQLTEAARCLVYSRRPILEIALVGGYESQQAFHDAFKAMYKQTPARFRQGQRFYPLQWKILPREEGCRTPVKEAIRLATEIDSGGWMELVAVAIDGYPCLWQEEYKAHLRQAIAEKRAWILREEFRTEPGIKGGKEGYAIGAMIVSPYRGQIEFLAVHPQYRRRGITELFLAKLQEELPAGEEISLTTYRAGDRADTGYRREYLHLGFEERELLVEYGYPTQRLVLSSRNHCLERRTEWNH